MSLQVTSPKNGDAFSCGTPVTFKGKADNETVRVEIFAEQWHLGSVNVESGEWTLTYPAFTGVGRRQIMSVYVSKVKATFLRQKGAKQRLFLAF